MNSREEIVTAQIIAHRAVSIDPFEVFERMKLVALDSMIDYALQCNKDLLIGLRKSLETKTSTSSDVLNTIGKYIQSIDNELLNTKQ